MNTPISSDKYAVIIGTGLTGMSIARYLKNRGEKFLLLDTRDDAATIESFTAKKSGFECQFGALDKQILVSASCLYVSPGISLNETAIRDAINAGVALSSDIDLLRQATPSPFIAVTGSNGKTTTVTLLAEMAKASNINACLAGNVGVPVLDAYMQAQENGNDYDCYILELSSFQLERCQPINAVAATILNITPDHLDRYSSMDEYHFAKQKIYQGAQNIIVNRNDQLTEAPVTQTVKRTSFALSKAELSDFGIIEVDGEKHLCKGLKPLVALSKLKVIGSHNYENILAALALGDAAGFSMPAMLNAAVEFTGVTHRCEWVGEHHQVQFINDSKATNEGACIAALSSLSQQKNIVLIAGGDAKGADLSSLAKIIDAECCALVLIGKDAQEFERCLHQLDSKLLVSKAESMQEAVNQASAIAKPNQIVLLSPACASLDMFKNYEARGHAFTQAVRNLGGGNAK